MEDSPQPRSRERRRGISRYIVPHDSFYWYTQVIFVSSLIVLGALGTGGWFYQQQLYEAIGLPTHGQIPTVVEYYRRMSIVSAGVVVLTSTFYVTIVAGLLFHRIGGPIYHLQRHIQLVIDGDPNVRELKFRDTDQLSDLADMYNQLLHSQDLLEKKSLEQTRD